MTHHLRPYEGYEIVPGLILSGRFGPPSDFESMGVDAIVALEEEQYAWGPAVPEDRLYLRYPIRDAETVDGKVREVARLVAALVKEGNTVLVHCLQGMNRSALVAARALMYLGHSTVDAIELVRDRRGVDEDGFGALSNPAFVAWLLAERDDDLPGPGRPGDTRGPDRPGP